MLSRPSGRAMLLLSFSVCLVLALALAPTQSALAFGPVEYHLAGSIGGKLAVQMELHIEDGKVSGHYWYEAIGTPLELAGTLADGRMRLTERTADGKATGSWIGAFNPLNPVWKGKWTSADGTKSLTFELTEAAEIVITEEMRMGFIKVHVAHPLFSGASRHRGLQDVQALVDREVWAAAASIWADPVDPVSDDYEFEPDAPWWSWEHFSEVTMRYYSSSLISMMNEVYHFTGGAHGMTFHTSMNLKVGKTGACSVLNRCGVRPSQIRGGTQIAWPWPSLCPRRLCGSFRTVTFSEGEYVCSRQSLPVSWRGVVDAQVGWQLKISTRRLYGSALARSAFENEAETLSRNRILGRRRRLRHGIRRRK